MTPCYKPYPEYKPSGVEWLGDVPAGWEMARNKYIAKFYKGKNPKELKQDTNSELVPYLSMGYLRGRDSCQYASLEAGLYRAKHGQILIIWDGSNAGEFVLSKDGILSSTMAASELGGSIDEIFYWYVSKALEPEIRRTAVGMGIPHVNGAELKNSPIPFPSLPEQRAIALFLDRETGKIDVLIGKQERMIQLLKEKRQAVISHAVTQGLNPDAPMKDSGIEWLGEIPEGWGVKTVKSVAHVGNGSTPKRDNTAYWKDGSFPWLNSSVVNQEQVTKSEQFVTDIALLKCHLPKLKPPVILVGITGQGRTRGMATILLCEATINQHVAYVKARSKMISIYYLRRVFDMAYSYLRCESEGGGSTKGAITCEQIKSLKIPSAPYDEQKAIVQYLETESSKIDTLISKAEQAIGLMKERRTALISAAVTGKIDVRGM